MSCGFTSRSTQNRSFQRRSSQTISWLSTEKLKQAQHKQTRIRNEIYYNKKLTQKTKPGLVASYDNRPGNRDGLFWFRCFINLSRTYMETYPLTYSRGPRDLHGVVNERTNEQMDGQPKNVIPSPMLSGSKGLKTT